MRFLLFILFTILFISCAQKAPQKIEIKNPVLMSSCNTEQEEWTSLYTIKKDSNAHSGNSVAFIDSLTIYSVGYMKSMDNISKTQSDSVVFSYWTYFKNEKAQAKTVLSIDDPSTGKNVFWVGNPVKEKVKEYNKWISIREKFVIPKNINPKCVLKVYVWNTSKEEILLDDFNISFY